MLKRTSQPHPAFERFLSSCGRISGQRKHPLLACLAPPTVRTKARFMNVHRLVTWADRVLPLSPPGGAKRGSIFAKLRAARDDLPACKALIQRFRCDAGARLPCQQILKTQGLSPAPLAPCEPLIDAIPTIASARSLAPISPLSSTPPRPEGSIKSACRSVPRRLHPFSGWPSATGSAKRRLRLASPFVCRPFARCQRGRKPRQSSRSVSQGNASSWVASPP
jgi:hypothetical protein